MKVTKTILFCAALLIGPAAWAQDFPRFEVAADYSYARYNPSPSQVQSLSLNGGGGAAVVNINEYVGIKMDLQGYGSNNVTWNIRANGAFPNGGTFKGQGNLFTYMFGPQVKFRSPRFQPFVHALFGGGHTNVYANAFQNVCVQGLACSASKAPSGNAFAMALGGGFDLPINKTVSFRPVELDYLMTRFNNAFTSNQNNFRYSAGVNFSFGGGSY